MDSPPTLQTLKLDCLLEIFKYVPLPVCMSLRSTCSQLKTAVDEHFRTGVKALPVMLSSHYSPEYSAKLNRYCQSHGWFGNLKVTISSGVSQRKFWDRSDLYLFREEHFFLEDYLVLFNPVKFGEFVAFITKYLPNVTKLALLIDNNDHLKNISSILNLYRKQLKVLKLEKTRRSGIMFHHENSSSVREQRFELPNEFYDSLNSLEALEALYFFTKSWQFLRLGDTTKNEIGRNVADPASPGHQCIDRLARRLKVLHIMCDVDAEYQSFRFKPEAYESLEELACWHFYVFQETNTTFPRLEKFIFASESNYFEGLSEVMPNLRYISTYNLPVTKSGIANLNSFPNLERISCSMVGSYLYDRHDEGVPGFNRTVQYIEVYRRYGDQINAQYLEGLKHSMSFFINLKKVIVREPYTELTAADLFGSNQTTSG